MILYNSENRKKRTKLTYDVRKTRGPKNKGECNGYTNSRAAAAAQRQRTLQKKNVLTDKSLKRIIRRLAAANMQLRKRSDRGAQSDRRVKEERTLYAHLW